MLIQINSSFSSSLLLISLFEINFDEIGECVVGVVCVVTGIALNAELFAFTFKLTVNWGFICLTIEVMVELNVWIRWIVCCEDWLSVFTFDDECWINEAADDKYSSKFLET